MTYYELLGVNWQACEDVITHAYKRLARIMHPDKGGDTSKFAEITAAWATLKDKKKRAAYNMDLQQHWRSCTSCSGKGTRYKQAGFNAKTFQQCSTCNGLGLITKEL